MKIGYACLNIGLYNCKYKTCKLVNASEEKLHEIIENNLNALEVAIDYNIKCNIKLFRISSDIIPFGSHSINKIKWWEDYKEELDIIGDKIKKNDIRVSMHPGQYTIINSPNESVVNNSINDLVYHNRFLDSIGADSKNKIILHIGGVYNDKKNSINSFIKNYKNLPSRVKNRLVIENDEKSYNANDVLNIASKLKIPAVFDILHHEINPSLYDKTKIEILNMFEKTWNETDGNMKIHYSQQKKGAKNGAHSNTILYKEFLDFFNIIKDRNLDIMLEVKDKNLSCNKIKNIIEKNINNVINFEWPRYKYFVMGNSYSKYKKIQKLINDKDENIVLKFYDVIESIDYSSIDLKAQLNTIQHIWGYFKDDKYRSKYRDLLLKLQNGNDNINQIKKFLLNIAVEKNNNYLIDSLYFYNI